jgi:hypothetical protein
MASELLTIIASGPRSEPVHLVLDTELVLRDSA